MSFEPIVIEQNFKSSVEEVWKAITDESQMKEWYFNQMAEFRAEVGFETAFEVDCEGEIYRHMWKVTIVEPESKIAYEWSYDGIPGKSTAVWELSESADGTLLKLTHSGGETFPQDNPLFSRESGLAGWNYLIGENLVAFLEQQ